VSIIPCRNGHVVHRVNGKCPECKIIGNRRRALRWARTNLEKKREIYRKWRTSNIELARSISRKSVAQWRRRNLDITAEQSARYKSIVRRASPKWLNKSQKMEMVNFYREARRISKETGIMHHVDHIFPLQAKTCCGLHVPWNMQVLVGSDNIRKRNILPGAQV
jgi:hypothetical protein